MLIGEYNHSVDQKGRMAIPVRFRATFSSGAVITRGIDKCLFIFSKQEWDELAEKIAKLPLVQANSRAFARLMFAGAVNVELDSQGRVLVPDYLRHYADLAKQVVVAGVFNRLEVWDKSNWSTYKQKTEKESEDIAERLSELGI
ncbi:MAG: cell division/cell wall cluster transcriptional repressor MraZ [Spirochaetes bacterium GWB1_48_6]|nr:MAG: Protein MraZ [Parcubacteria group bacterium GW2011_GWF1_45_5]KKU47614.1 MAG: Protein MraZ [Parcubacteria group bacterium GW2011_GWF2_46_8]OHD13929.1 MAG: cell division/cell wall cluster transcriptional repressor MraZ [Spirochaetes bacterium GWB1_48_6]